MSEILSPIEPEQFRGYKILAIGEGGGDMGPKDVPIAEYFGAVSDKIAKGAAYLSLEKVAEGIFKRGRRLTPRQRQDRYVEQSKLSKNENRNFIVGDAKKLPFSDRSINEIWMQNMFSDPSRPVGAESIIEAARVLKKGGSLYIVEHNTPKYGYFIKEQNFQRQGLEKEVYVGDALKIFLAKQGVKDFFIQHISRSRPLAGEPFAIAFRKM